jgi:hypothetical protein
MVRGSGTGCPISPSPLVSVVDGAPGARRRRTMKYPITPEIMAAPRTPPRAPPTILPWFELPSVVGVGDGPGLDVVGKMSVPVTSGLSERHKEMRVDRAESKYLAPPTASAAARFQLLLVCKDTVEDTSRASQGKIREREGTYR